MLHPATRLTWMNDDVGYGVIATEDIPMGTILWALDPLDRVFGPSEIQTLDDAGLMPILERDSCINGRGKRVLCWDNGRFMNHSCDPVSLSPGTEFELAVRDIAAGEELTCDYTSLNLEEDLHCLCGHPGCRGSVSSNDFDTIAPLWDARLRIAIGATPHVAQPLMRWVEGPAMLPIWAENRALLPSALRHRYPVRDTSRAARS